VRTSKSLGPVISAALVAVGLTVVAVPSPPAAAADAATERPVPSRPYSVNESLSGPTDHTDPAWLHPTVSVPPATTVEVDVPADGWATVGSLPVSVARPSSGVAPSRVRVRMLSQVEVAAAGGQMLGFDLTRADGGTAMGAVAVSLDYAGIARAYGGDFASRLRLTRVPDCTADQPCTPLTVAATNDIAASLLRSTSLPVRPDPTATPTGENTGSGPAPDSGYGPQPGDPSPTSVLPQGTTFAAMTAPSGPNGDYTASALSGSDDWTVGVGSGAFTYSYPVDVPPAVAGPAPALSLDYDSQAVDGRTLATNGQASKVGEGWSFEPGYIERRFHSCRDENMNQDDLCWSSSNQYFLHFLGHSGELVRTSATSNEWRLRGNDPAWRVLSFNSGGGNDDNDGEYFVVITPEGTRYWFGYGVEPRNTPTLSTNSALEVPVYGGSGEPCYNAVASASWCNQTYRWNVDRVLDTNDNVTSLFYAKEYNYYARARTSTAATRYARSGYLTRIEYGQRNGAENGTAYARVLVSTMDRCVTQSGCAAPTTNSARSDYPDVPLDLMCSSTVSCPATLSSPTFWSTKEITTISTQFWNAASPTPGYDSVASYALTYTLPATGDSTTPSLWLKDITKTGQYGAGTAVLPGVRMTGVNLQNRVNAGAGVPGMNKYRIETLSTDLGARATVTYGTPHPCPTNNPNIAWATNPYDCFPAWYDPHDNVTQPAMVPFRKYVVTNLVTEDMRGAQPARAVDYTYNDTPAWHYDDSPLALPGTQSWSDYRGYSDVRVHAAGGGASAGTDTRYLLFRGMYGDKLTSSTSKTDTVTDSTGAWFNDFDYRAGLPLEVKTYDPNDGMIATTLHRYWAAQTINGPDAWQSHDAYLVRESSTVQRAKNIDTGAWRDHVVDMTYSSSTGMPLTTSDEQTPGTATDDTCTKVDYANNTTTGTGGGDTWWIINAPYRSVTYAGTCGSGSTTVAKQTEIDYDNHVFTGTPSAGNVTQTREFTDATHKAVTKTGYDALGRVVSVIRPNEVASGVNGAETTTYTPATGYPYTSITTTTPPASTQPGAVSLTTTTVLYSAFGTPRQITDANGNVTKIGVDPLGRTTDVTRPGDPVGTPGLRFAYNVVAGQPNRVTTTRLLTATSSVTSYDYLDGFGRTVQSQLPEANDVNGDERRLVLTRYDTVGHKSAESQPFGTGGAPGSNLAIVDPAAIPHETRYGYDSAGRVYATTQYAYGSAQMSTHTNYHGWSYTVDAPVHSDVDYSTDVAGRTTRVVERDGTNTITTDYGYTPLGDLKSITDNQQKTTSYGYDWLRRRTSVSDPDQGNSSTTYSYEGDALTTTDAKTEMVTNVYDRLRRRTDTYAGTTTGTLLAHWTYDATSVANAKGRPTAATSYSGGAAYTTAVTAYDSRGRATGKRWDIPSAAGALAGSYAYTYGFDLADNPVSVTMPAAGGLPVESVTTVLNRAGLPVRLTTSLNSDQSYIANTAYFLDGRVATRNILGVARDYTYDQAAGRLSTAKSTVPLMVNGTPTTTTIEDVAYTYDDDNNVTSITDGVAGVGGVAQRECFTYDPLDRLKTAFTTGATTCTGATPTPFGTDPYSVGYAYDTVGDITSATNGGVTSTYAYAGSGHEHAPASIAGNAYAYDANGATTTRPTPSGAQTLTWNRLHQLDAVAGPGASTFVYDADGNRLLRTAGATSTLYLDGMEITAAPNGSGGTTVTAARFYGGVAMRTPATVTALLRNRQNSSAVAYDLSAGTVAYQRYTPFGSRRGTTALAATDRRFLDKSEDATGLVGVGARYYDPGVGRFVSVDPLFDAQRPQTLAGYSYALNNPASMSDPTGLMVQDPDSGGSGQSVAAKQVEQAYYRVLKAAHDVDARLLTDEESYMLTKHLYPAWDGDDSVRDDPWGQAAVETVFTAGVMGIVNGARAGLTAAAEEEGGSAAARTGSRALADAVAKEGDDVTEGIYTVITAEGEVYVGQSGNITRRLLEHVASGKISEVEAALAERVEVLGGKLNRELAEQLTIKSKGGIENLANKVNPIGVARQHLLTEVDNLGDLFAQLRASGTM
jgi:RHS repeat-associated protein